MEIVGEGTRTEGDGVTEGVTEGVGVGVGEGVGFALVLGRGLKVARRLKDALGRGLLEAEGSRNAWSTKKT